MNCGGWSRRTFERGIVSADSERAGRWVEYGEDSDFDEEW
jgi:hypothetical protein